ncbi:GLE1-like protein-domain-containing protein [Globomyces pollinis-pini]|nr:GLE1-like protein-domain-containing protein [Globomyces pollinis-pini]
MGKYGLNLKDDEKRKSGKESMSCEYLREDTVELKQGNDHPRAKLSLPLHSPHHLKNLPFTLHTPAKSLYSNLNKKQTNSPSQLDLLFNNHIQLQNNNNIHSNTIKQMEERLLAKNTMLLSDLSRSLDQLNLLEKEIQDDLKKKQQEAKRIQDEKQAKEQEELRQAKLKLEEQTRLKKEEEDQKAKSIEEEKKRQEQLQKSAEQKLNTPVPILPGEASEKNAQDQSKIITVGPSASTNPVNGNTSSGPSPRLVSPSAWDVAFHHLEKVNHIKKVIKPESLKDNAIQNKLFKDRMVINRTIGQLTPIFQNILVLLKKLGNTLKDVKDNHPNLYELVLYMLAKKVVKQAETEVSVRKETAFPLAVLCVVTANKHQPFIDILLGRMMFKCSYIIPCYQKKLPTETVPEYQSRLGYKMTNGTFETELQYNERMCGIVSLYAAIIQTKVPNIPNPFGIQHAWTWLARILNMKPRKLTPQLIYTFLEITGNALINEYRHQAKKMILVIKDQFIPTIPAAAISSTTRLQSFLEETVIKNGTIPICSGSDFAK